MLYQDTATSSKVIKEGSMILFHRFVSGMLMRVVVGFWWDLMKSRSLAAEGVVVDDVGEQKHETWETERERSCPL